ncbi:SGNH/GDSL hydrolase family protein [Actinophytocola gossypii]|uniref:SGNH/GDSL hydrolase family protein n=1 Tax=Actinophytocola gossypii TaxID=2812003 RepID=A0ABT2JH47_9PSEU|nr:SGNH/GDSL hydrolase family protein [Actinophytocola gossypii]MCT2587202.1 SGNH/GDSL hydrolase family protein [Actinophytocola gossypii]
MRRTSSALVAVLAAAMLVLATWVATDTREPAGHPPGPAQWVGTWGSVPTATPENSTPTVSDETVRQVVHTSTGGDALRLRLTNEFGDGALHIGEVRVARHAGTGTDIAPETDRAVTFGGQRSATVPEGAPLLSDPVPLRLPAGADLVVSVYLPDPTPVTTLHNFAYQENVVAAGNVTAERSVTATRTITQWYFLSGISVRTHDRDPAAVVALGDSITNGFETDLNANHRWPDLLADRLRRVPWLRDTGVLNLGVAGNRLLHDPNPPPGSEPENFAEFFGHSALRRFDRDVLARPGVTDVVVLIGVNDLGHPGSVAPPNEAVTAGELIAGYRQLIARAHAAGLEIHGGTILPFGGTPGLDTDENEAKRQAVNTWVRTSGEFDSVIDFARATRDPADPRRLNPAYDSGDHLHPNDAGMAAMADAVPLHLFR